MPLPSTPAPGPAWPQARAPLGRGSPHPAGAPLAASRSPGSAPMHGVCVSGRRVWVLVFGAWCLELRFLGSGIRVRE